LRASTIPTPLIAQWFCGIKLEDPAEAGGGIAAALARDGSVLVDAVGNRTELRPLPPSITMEMAKDSTRYVVRGRDERPR
jgi:pyruvate dehydrogenase (quinone)